MLLSYSENPSHDYSGLYFNLDYWAILDIILTTSMELLNFKNVSLYKKKWGGGVEVVFLGTRSEFIDRSLAQLSTCWLIVYLERGENSNSESWEAVLLPERCE